MKQAFVGQNTRLWSSQPQSGIATKASVNRGADFAGVAPTVDVTCQAEPPTKKTKVLASKEATKTLPSRLLPRRWPSQRPLVEGRAADGGTRSCLEYGYKVALVRFRVKYPLLEIKEDPYAILPKDDNVPMEVEVPFDDSDPLRHELLQLSSFGVAPSTAALASPSYSPPSLCAKVTRTDWRSFAIEINRVNTAREEDARPPSSSPSESENTGIYDLHR
ncbi:hypothetical protein B296_00032428 [Ensete ventricosum]|uniref:Uncharacterized protein n=1 Tax=Ensete ventricosum TaxID=4639 RepID=A0A426Y6F4_ENSVE|nr:hypothetical protein B296_00032428 [Ensete ventricosum]